MNSKITEISATNTSAAGHSSVVISLENGTKGEVYLGKQISSHDLVVGMDIEYETQDSPYGLKLKVRGLRDGKFTLSKGGGMPKKDTAGMAVGASINNAVMLISYGKIEIKDLKAVAKRILDVSIELKKEYEGKI
jgi:hypothetical protein